MEVMYLCKKPALFVLCDEIRDVIHRTWKVRDKCIFEIGMVGGGL